MLVVLALVAAACGADHPADENAVETARDGTPLCELRTPTDADMESVADPDHDEPEAASEEGHDEAPVSEEEHDEAPDMDDVDFVVDIEMREFEYSCALPTIDQGTTLALRFTNLGDVEHEAVVGSLDQQHDAEVEMAEMAEMDAGHDEVGGGHSVPAITLPAGEMQTMIVEFDEPGSLWVGCHVPGHWDAGMRNNFTVARA